ncbi:MAG: 2-dehydro-3-deoxygalactonokinase [Ancalomicrobiaceae bacterium]|nr:2-dehydro-3-deoxygalactonokinase [Ancalomicrobiaceae bacterium]
MASRVVIGIDWGSSEFRAYRFAADGSIADVRTSNRGTRSIAQGSDRDAAFEAALVAELGDWLAEGPDVVLSGMVCSRNGWVETPYMQVPVREDDLSRGVVSRDFGAARLGFLPGVAMSRPVADVMRGEEVEVFGANLGPRPALVVLPGTHSKWAHVSDGRIESFATIITGELFELLRHKSLIGELADGDEFNELAFLSGVDEALDDLAESGGLVRRLFGARAGVLVGGHPAVDVSSYLSGLLIGNEIHEADRMFGAVDRAVVVGTPLVTERYDLALKRAGIITSIAAPDAAARGLWRIASRLRVTR